MQARGLVILVVLASGAGIGLRGWAKLPQNEPARTPTTLPAQVDARLLSGLIGSKHDFSADGRFPRDLCLPCHTPHVPLGPVPALDARPQARQALRPFQTTGVELDQATLRCLSCHDGVIASDVFSYGHATSAATQFGRSATGGPRVSHPVGIAYPVGDAQYHPASTVTTGSRIQLPDGRIQCVSCHDPHNTHGHPGMLVMSNERSRLCLSCHRL